VKALVLSGGSGTRLRPFTHTTPKQLMPLANRPQLELVVENVAELGVTEVGIVVGDRADQIAATIGDGSRFGVRVTYVPQERPLGLAHAVAIARPFLGDDDFVLHLGDTYIRGATLVDAAAEFHGRGSAAHVVVHKVLDPSRYGIVVVDGDGTVRDLQEKPAKPRGDLAIIGIYFFRARIHDAIAAIRPGTRGELEITDAMQQLVSAGAPVSAGEFRGYWRDTGTVEDYLACNRNALELVGDRRDGEIDAGSVVVGPVVVAEGAVVRRSVIEGPAALAAGAVVEDGHIGPNVSLGAGAAVYGSRVEESILLAGAKVTAGARLTESVVGHNAHVDGPLAATGAHVLLGDHGWIAA